MSTVQILGEAGTTLVLGVQSTDVCCKTHHKETKVTCRIDIFRPISSIKDNWAIFGARSLRKSGGGHCRERGEPKGKRIKNAELIVFWPFLHHPQPIVLLFGLQPIVPRASSQRQSDADRVGGRDGQVECAHRQQYGQGLLDIGYGIKYI